MIYTVHLLKPAKQTTITYQSELLERGPGYVSVRAVWERPALDLGYVVFETGDIFYEYYYTERWFNIMELRDTDLVLKGWYCNITRPAQLDGDVLLSEDLEIDLFVSPDRRALLRLDLDEFAALQLDRSDPAAHAAALDALEQLEQMARSAAPPFDRPLRLA